MLWYRYRQVPGRQNRLPLADSRGAHVHYKGKGAHTWQRWTPVPPIWLELCKTFKTLEDMHVT